MNDYPVYKKARQIVQGEVEYRDSHPDLGLKNLVEDLVYGRCHYTYRSLCKEFEYSDTSVHHIKSMGESFSRREFDEISWEELVNTVKNV